jgi:acetylornithine deacetylase/succinyl-diaminopimelate desuccinylase-like protein
MPPLRQRALRLVALAAALAAPFAAQIARAEAPGAPPAVVAEAKQLLAKLIAIDTTSAGSTAPAVELLAAHLRGAGFPAEDLWIGGTRAERSNLVVRLRGAPSARAQRPILFLSHLDVVAANREDWTVDPFRLTERDGFLYGRGTLDIKGEVANLAMAFARAKREGFVPARELILALTADEEGGDENGVAWLLEHERARIEAAYAVNTDAGGLQQERGRLVRMPVQTSEKIYLTFELAVTSAGGHSALPPRENAITRLAHALVRLDGFAFPVALNDTTRAFFERLAAHEPGELAAAFRGVIAKPSEPAAVEALSAIPIYNAALRSVCTPTLLAAGHAENALPQRATAALQCRLLPGDDPDAVREALIARIADSEVRVTATQVPLIAPASPLEPELFAAVEAVTQQMWPGVPVLPVMDPWTTDGVHTRSAGLATYGVSGIAYDVDDVRSHGADERIAVAAFEQGLEFMYRLVRRLGGARE